MDLLRAELNRLRYRRRFLWGLLAVLLVSLAAPMLWMDAARPLSQQELAEAQATFDSIPVGDCPECSVADFLRDPWPFSVVVESGILPFVVMVAVMTLGITVLYVGSDFRSGAVATQLTFTPRRTALVLTRSAVSGLLGGCVMAIATVVSTVVSAIWFIALNGYEAFDATPALLGLVLAALFYGLVLGSLGGLLTVLAGGASLAATLLLGVFVVDVLTLSLSVEATLPGWVYHLLPTQQAYALLHGSAESYNMAGEMFLTIGRVEAVVYHLLVVLLVAAVTLPLFERRDIKN
ncbi:hypothetical protein TESS_TESS_01724 [Tessaracoccus sp. O5.2]|uniref:ABC transporter permease subunit n=1 Tax=Tessaracoccus sp. O5.2 TaxID=3157622 RepID=UPI0035E5CDB7